MPLSVVDEVDHRTAGSLRDPATLSVISIRCRSVVHRLDAVFGVIGVAVGAIVQQVSSGIVTITVDAVIWHAVVLGTGEGEARLRPRTRTGRKRLCPAIAIPVI